MSYELTDFQTDIIDSSMQTPVVVDFWAPWCEPCKTLGPVLERLAEEAGDLWKLVKVNVDDHQHVAQSFQVQSIPTVFLVHQGQVVDGFAGALPENQVREWLKPHVGELSGEEGVDPQDAEIEEMAASGNKEQALAMQRKLVEETPDDEEQRIKLATMLIFDGTEEAQALLETIEADSKNHHQAEKLLMLVGCLVDTADTVPAHPHAQAYYVKALEALRVQNWEETLDQFLEVLYRDKTYHEGAARKGFIGVFEYLGRDHEITKAFQRRFEMAMF